MLEYKLYCIDATNHIVSRHDCRADDDLAALDRAQAFCNDFEIEAWQGTRLVGRIAKGGAASFVHSAGPHGAA